MSGIFLINHSPKLRTDAPNHEDMNTPTMKMNVIEVTNPRPVKALVNVRAGKEPPKIPKPMPRNEKEITNQPNMQIPRCL